MTFAHKATRYCLAVLFAPLLFLGAEAGAAPIQSPRIPPSEHTEIRQLTMEFRHPVADGARAETVTNPAYNILIAYADGRSLYITSEGQTLNEHETGVEDALLTWADAAFATGGKQMP